MKEVMRMKVRVKRRRPKPTAWWKLILRFVADLVSAVLAGLITAAIAKWFGW